MSLRIHLMLLGLLCVVGAGAAAVVWMTPLGGPDPRPPTQGGITASLGRPMGGEFALVDHTGRAVTAQDFAGKTRLVFFGFTHCPDVCPTGLSRLSLLLEELGEQAKDVRALFITVDPERDTPEVMKDYVSNFAGNIIGLTGTPEQIAAVAKSFHAYFKKAPQPDGGYLVDHTASIFVLDRNGDFRATIDIHEDPSAALQKVLRLIRASGSRRRRRRRGGEEPEKTASGAIGSAGLNHPLLPTTNNVGFGEAFAGLETRLQELILTCLKSRKFDAELLTLGRNFWWAWHGSRKESLAGQRAKREFNGGARRLSAFIQWYNELPQELAQRFSADIAARSPRSTLAALERLHMGKHSGDGNLPPWQQLQANPDSGRVCQALVSLLQSWVDHLVDLAAETSGKGVADKSNPLVYLCNGVADLCDRGLGIAFEGSPRKETPCRTLLLGLVQATDPAIPVTAIDIPMQSIKWARRRRQRERRRCQGERAVCRRHK